MSFVQGPTNSQIVKHFGTDLSPEVQSKLKDIFDIYSEMTLEEKMDQVFKASVLTALRVNSHDEQFEFHEELHTGHYIRFAEQTMTNEEHERQKS